MPRQDATSLRSLLRTLVDAERKQRADEMADLARSVDQSVARRIRQRRLELGITQQRLAELVGVASQQQHKYERGLDRITAGRLQLIAKALGADIEYFFSGAANKETARLAEDDKREAYHAK